MSDVVILRDESPVIAETQGGLPGPKGDPGSPGEGHPTRNAIAALTPAALDDTYLTEVGRRGKFVFDGSNLSTKVAADTRQGVYIAPASAPTGASGAWVRQFDGPLNVAWFGAVADGVTNDFTAINEAMGLAPTHGKRVRIPAGNYAVQTALNPPDDVTVEGDGGDTVVIAAGASEHVFNLASKTGVTIRNMKVRGASAGTVWRAGIHLSLCSQIKVEGVTSDDTTDSTLLFAFDSDDCVFDKLYFDGGAGLNGYAAYLVGCRGCKVTNSSARRCSQGFAISGNDVDPESTRTTQDSFGNIIDACHVRECDTHSFNINAAVGNIISNCSAEDYAGSINHWAFQTKDIAGDATRANVITGCTVDNYPSGFGAQESSHTVFMGCTAQNVDEYGFMLNSAAKAKVIGASVYEFGLAGIWIGSGTRDTIANGVHLETATATAKGILIVDGDDNNFDNVTTRSTLAAFIDIAAGCDNNRFGRGCRAFLNPIVDASGASEWPIHAASPIIDVAVSGSKVWITPFQRRGMTVAKVRFVVTTAIVGSPLIDVGRDGDTNLLVAAQAVSGAATTINNLTQVSATLAAGQIPVAELASVGTSGKGYVQIEGLIAL